MKTSWYSRAVTRSCVVQANAGVAKGHRHFSTCAWLFISSRIKENYLKSVCSIPPVRHYSTSFVYVISFHSCNADMALLIESPLKTQETEMQRGYITCQKLYNE